MQTYTIAEIGKKLGIPESNLRYYRDKFSDFLPSTGEGRKKRYYPEAVAVFSAIAEEIAKGATAVETAEILAQTYTREAKIVTNETTTTTTTTTTPQPFAEAVLTLMAQQQQQISAAVTEMRELRQELAATKASQTKIEAQLQDHYSLVDQRLRQVMEEEKQQPKGFWQRLFGK